MKQFNLEEWLQDKNRKVVTRDGRPVRIVCWDRKYDHDDFPIIALEDWDNGEFVNFVSSNGKVDLSGSENIHDLFFADEEEELTEFENTMVSFAHAMFDHLLDVTKEIDIKEWKDKLLDLARKELERNNTIVDKDKYLRICDYYYEQGKQDALKDLPKWKKCTGSTGPFIDYNAKGEEYLYLKDYVIKISELEKLPKEE